MYNIHEGCKLIPYPMQIGTLPLQIGTLPYANRNILYAFNIRMFLTHATYALFIFTYKFVLCEHAGSKQMDIFNRGNESVHPARKNKKSVCLASIN